MKKATQSKIAPQSDNTVSIRLQKLFIAASLLVYVFATLIQIKSAVDIIRYSSAIPSLLWWTLFPIITPLLFFATAYLVNPRKRFDTTPIFENMLLAVIGLGLFAIIDAVVQQIVGPFSNPHSSVIGYFVVDILVGAICLILFGIGGHFLLRPWTGTGIGRGKKTVKA
jgi:hypothetical protein